MLLYKSGSPNDVLSSIDISVAFLQATPYDPLTNNRYVSYKSHKYAKTKYYKLLGPLYGQRSASKDFYITLSIWLEENG